MATRAYRVVLACLSALSLQVLPASAHDVEVRFDLHDPAKTMFPSNLFTVLDFSNNTFRRVNLPKPPDCSATVVLCQDIDVLNTLDGFNVQPRLAVPFSGPIDVSSVNSDTVFVVSLGSTTRHGAFGDKIGINQIVWNPATNTLYAETDELLEPHTRYALVVTNGVRDTNGKPVDGPRFARWLWDFELEGLDDRVGHKHRRIVAASIFTTMSTTSILEKIRRQIKSDTPEPATFAIGANGERAVFPLNTINTFAFNRQVTVEPAFARQDLPLRLLLDPRVVGQVAFGKFSSRDYRMPGEFIPPVGTRTGKPTPQGVQDTYFNLIVPTRPRPANGWPIAIFGHGLTDSKQGGLFLVATAMAQAGIATIGINAAGHGGGTLGTIEINGSAAFPAGGRGIDQNGDGRIDSTEGVNAAVPRTLLGSADGLRQTTADLMQLVRQIQVGMDVDGDGVGDFDPSSIYYFGQSFGGIYGTLFLAIEPDVLVGVPNVAGGPIADIIRLSPGFRNGLLAPAVAVRNLANLPPLDLGGGVLVPQFNENSPLRNLPAVIDTVPGADALQLFLDRLEWAGQSGDAVAYAPYLRKSPLPGARAKSVIYQFAKGDMTIPNPTTTALLRAGDLADRATYYRNDVAFAVPGSNVSRNPHTFLTNFLGGGLAAQIAFIAQGQIATFFASNGTNDSLPPGAELFFEEPIRPPLPEELNYLP